MSNRFARAASTAAVGAIFVGVLPGVASAAAAPVVAVTPPVAFHSGAAKPTPFKAALTGADASATDVSLRFRLSGPKALDAADVLLEAYDAATKTWAPVTFTDIDQNSVGGTYGSAIALPAGATVPVDLQVKITDPIVDGPLSLTTEVVDNADDTVLHTDTDELDVIGVPAPQLTAPAALGDVESGKYLPFNLESSNSGAELYDTVMRIEASAETVPAGTELFLQREYPWWPGHWYDVPMTRVGDKFVTSNTNIEHRHLYTDQTQTTKWRLGASDSSVLGKVTVTAALLDRDEQSTVHDTAVMAGSFAPSTVDTTVDFTGFDTVLKSGTPVQGAITVANNHDAEAFTGHVRFVLDGQGLRSHEISGTVEDPANPGVKSGINLFDQAGKVVGTFPVSALAAKGQQIRNLEITLNDNSRDGTVGLAVGVVAEKTTFASKSGSLQLQATTTVPQPEGVQFYGTKNGMAVVSWKGSTDPAVSHNIAVIGEASEDVWINTRNPNSRTVHMPRGVPVTVAVRTAVYDRETGIRTYSVPVFKTYTAPAVALPTPSDIEITPDNSDGRLVDMITWKGTADFYRVLVTDTKTRYRDRYYTSIGQVSLSNLLEDDAESGRTYTISVVAVDDMTEKVGQAVSTSYAPRAPEAPAAKLGSVRGTNVVSWTNDPRALFTVLVNNKAIPVTGNSVAVDRYLVAGANTVTVTAENAYGSEVTDLTVTTSTVKAAAADRNVVFGDAVKFTGTITATPAAGRSVQAQQYDAAKKAWNGVGATAKTDAKGKFSLGFEPSRSGSYRVALLAAGESAGAVTAATAVAVAPDTSLAVSDTSVRAGQTVTLTAKPAGAVAGTKVTFQQLVGKTWKWVGSDEVTRGAASAKVKLTTRGTVSLRAVVAGTSTTVEATSGVAKVSVK